MVLENEFMILIREIDQAIILDLSGDLTKNAEDKLLQLKEWDKGLNHGKQYLILNLTNVHYMNSNGIAILIRLVRAGAKGGYQTFAYGLTSHYKKLLRMVGLTEHLMIYTNEKEILEQITKK